MGSSQKKFLCGGALSSLSGFLAKGHLPLAKCHSPLSANDGDNEMIRRAVRRSGISGAVHTEATYRKRYVARRFTINLCYLCDTNNYIFLQMVQISYIFFAAVGYSSRAILLM